MSKLYIQNKVPARYERATWMDIIQPVEATLNLLAEHYQGKSNGAPTTGAYARCDWFLNSLPSPSGYFGFVCVDAGTPGTWKGFGLIEA